MVKGLSIQDVVAGYPNKLTAFIFNIFHMTVKLTSSNFNVFVKHNAVWRTIHLN